MDFNAVARCLTWPVTLVGAQQNGKHNVMTTAWVTQVSVNPLLILVSIGPGRFTHDMIAGTGEFVISILSSEQKEISSFCGSRSGRDTDKIARLKLATVPSSVVKAPRIAGCVANLECRLVDRHTAGDHTLFIGEVVATDLSGEELKPLLMYRGKPGTFKQE